MRGAFGGRAWAIAAVFAFVASAAIGGCASDARPAVVAVSAPLGAGLGADLSHLSPVPAFGAATAAGTRYGFRETVLDSGDRAGLLVPQNPGQVLVVYAHSKNGSWNQFSATPGWQGLREWLLDRGVSVVETEGAANGWGGSASRTSYVQAVRWAKSVVPARHIVVLGFSMGGLVSYWLATESDISRDVTGLIVSSGTTDLVARYGAASGVDLAELNAVYGIPGDQKQPSAFARASAPFDPMRLPAEAFARVHVLQMWGDADTVVSPRVHGAAWVRKYGSATRSLSVAVAPGGGHSPGNGATEQLEQIPAWLERILPAGALRPA